AVARLDRSLGELAQRRERLGAEILDGARKQGELAAGIVAAREALHGRASAAMDAHARLGEARAEVDAERSRLRRHESSLRETRTRIERETQRSNELSLRLSRLEMEMQHLLEHVEERHRLDVRRVLGDYHGRPIQDETHKERLSDLLRLVERMGEIN